MEKIGVIGAGNMGSGIAQKTAQEGLNVVLIDMKQEFVDRGMQNIRQTLESGVSRGIFRAEQVEDIVSRIRPATDIAEASRCDLVIEAIFEDMKAKTDLFKSLDRECSEGTILATNTSSFSVSELAASTERPDRFIGLHFFYHPAKNRLLEIIPGKMTSMETIEAAKRYSLATGKTEIIVKDSPGFAVNRFFVPWLNEAVRIMDEGWAGTATIEQAAKERFGVGMGPFELMNVTGIPIAFHSTMSLENALGEFYAPAAGLKARFESGQPWDLAQPVDENLIHRAGNRLLAAVFYVVSCMIDEETASPADIDLGAKVGLRWSRGPFELMNKIGVEHARDLVQDLLSDRPAIPVPSSLAERGRSGEPWDIRYVDYFRDGPLGRVIISRPEAMNALNHTVLRQLDEAFRKAQADEETKAVVIESKGKAFVAGADIGFFIDCIIERRLKDNVKFTTYGQEVYRRIDESPKPVIAKVDGLALGGGLELALTADAIVASTKAVMGFPETGIGIYPGLGGTQRTSRYVGKELAKYLVFTGRILLAHEALEIGLVDHVVEPAEMDQTVKRIVLEDRIKGPRGRLPGRLPEKWATIADKFRDEHIPKWLSGEYTSSSDPFEMKTAKIIISKAPIALKLANRIMDEGYNMPIAEATGLELKYLAEIFSTEDALTGLKSVGKGKPVFQGR
jgi:enoyl-CoA hydratase / 3-hydroxyacyl-CoA dehydrogenase